MTGAWHRNLKTNLVEKTGDFLASTPWLYDATKSLYRKILPNNRPLCRVLNRFSLAHRPVGFIQVGANDGLRGDFLREFIVRDKWHGVLVEPLPTAFERLLRNYGYLPANRLAFLNAAIAYSQADSLEFWTYTDSFLTRFSPNERLNLLQRSTFSKDLLLQFRYPVLDDTALKAISVPCTTLEDIASTYFPQTKIDLIAIDAEGHEAEIIPQIDYNRLKPTAMLFEFGHLGSAHDAVMDTLHREGYIVYTESFDAFALQADSDLHRDIGQLLPALSV